MTTKLDTVCRVLCKSGKFETGEGTCAPICMGMLGNAREECDYRDRVHMKLAGAIINALEDTEEAA